MVLWLLFTLHLCGLPIPPAIAWIGVFISFINWAFE